MSIKVCLDWRCNGQHCNNNLKTLNTYINNVWNILQEKIKLKVLKKAKRNTMNRAELILNKPSGLSLLAGMAQIVWLKHCCTAEITLARVRG